MKKFCSNCGNELREDAKFCDKCGQKTDIINNEFILENENSPNKIKPKRKKGCLIAILIIILIPIFLGVLGAILSKNTNKTTNTINSDKTASSSEPVKVEKEKEPEVKTITIGNTINSKSYNLTINKIEFSYDVLPDKTSGFYTHYPAENGSVYINIDADIKNTQKQDLRCDKIMKVEANYNNGYTYNSTDIVEDTTTGFTYSNISSIKPLETQGMRFLIKCPQEVAESSNPLNLTFAIDGEKYNYTMR